jgi:hypothetical protein
MLVEKKIASAENGKNAEISSGQHPADKKAKSFAPPRQSMQPRAFRWQLSFWILKSTSLCRSCFSWLPFTDAGLSETMAPLLTQYEMAEIKHYRATVFFCGRPGIKKVEAVLGTAHNDGGPLFAAGALRC